MNQILKLILNESEYLSFEIGYNFQEMRLWDDVMIYFKGNENYLLYDFHSDLAFDGLITLLSKASMNNLKLYPSIKNDLGYLWNEDSNAVVTNIPNEKLEYRMVENTPRWVGEDFLLWSTPGSARPPLSTWIYNNSQGEIIMEVTPSYSWHFDEPQLHEKFCSYEEFMKNYKPVLTRIIPPEIAKEWIKQSEYMLQMIEKKAVES